MKKFRSASIFFIVSASLFTCDTERNLSPDFSNFFIKYYGDNGNQQAVDLVVNSDGTLVLLGNSQNEQNGKHFFVVKTNSAGAILWQQVYGTADANDETAVDIEPTLDGNYVIAVQKTISLSEVEVQLVKISQTGEILREQLHGFPNKLDSVRSVTPLIDGSFLITGSTNKTKDIINSEIEAFVFKCDENFIFEEILWNDTYGAGHINQGIKILENAGTFYLFMVSNNQKLGGNDYNFFVQAINSDASPEGSGGALPDAVTDVDNEKLTAVTHVPSINGFAFTGTSESVTGSKTVYTVITGSPPNNENIINTGNQKLNYLNQFSGNYSGKSIYPSSFGGFLVLADREVTIGNVTTKTIVLIRLDSQGRLLFSNDFGGEFTTSGTAIAELPDGKIVLVGTARLDSQEKLALIQVNSNGLFRN